MMQDLIAGIAALLGVAFVVVAAAGIVRMEDVFTRLHAASKAAPFGATLVLVGVAVASGSADVVVRVVVICLFLLMTAPIAAHVIGRAAYLEHGAPGPEIRDDLQGRYDRERGKLHSATAEEVGGASGRGF